jgi:hypothetical protein
MFRHIPEKNVISLALVGASDTLIRSRLGRAPVRLPGFAVSAGHHIAAPRLSSTGCKHMFLLRCRAAAGLLVSRCDLPLLYLRSHQKV